MSADLTAQVRSRNIFWGSSSESGLISEEEWPLAQKQWGPPPRHASGARRMWHGRRGPGR